MFAYNIHPVIVHDSVDPKVWNKGISKNSSIEPRSDEEQDQPGPGIRDHYGLGTLESWAKPPWRGNLQGKGSELRLSQYR